MGRNRAYPTRPLNRLLKGKGGPATGNLRLGWHPLIAIVDSRALLFYYWMAFKGEAYPQHPRPVKDEPISEMGIIVGGEGVYCLGVDILTSFTFLAVPFSSPFRIVGPADCL